MLNGPTRFGRNTRPLANPPPYPKGESYTTLLSWHLNVWGTNPDGDTTTQSIPWDKPEFARRIIPAQAEKGTSHKYVVNWTKKNGTPPKLEFTANRILEELFGNKRRFEEWYKDLWKARNDYYRKNPPFHAPIWEDDDFSESLSIGAVLPEEVIAPEHQPDVRGQYVPVTGQAGVGRENAVVTTFAHHQWHKFKAEPTNLIELLRTDMRATTLVGRTDELLMLSQWLSGPEGIAVKCIIGGAGAGKTRLAIEACEAAEATGWFSTFLQSSELQPPHDMDNLANWALPRPALIVVDYAASSVSAIKRWFAALAVQRNRIAHKLRILLLERHADRKNGWWADLARPDSNSHPSAADLIRGEEPYALQPLEAVSDRRALLGEIMAKAAPLFDPPQPAVMPPAFGVDAWFDRRIADSSVDNEPLYLAMAGIRSVECGAPAALAMNRLELAYHIANIEECRIGKFANSHGFIDDGKFLKHVICCITLQGGCEYNYIIPLVKEERESMGLSVPIGDEGVAEIVCDFLPSVRTIEPVKPDLIGEIFCLSSIRGGRARSLQAQIDIVLRAYRRASQSTIDTLIRCACDLADGQADHYSIDYLTAIAKTSGEAAVTIAFCLPPLTLSLREFAASINSYMVELANSASEGKPEEYKTRLALCLSKLGDSMNLLGRREEASECFNKVVTLTRELVPLQPDTFTPLLAAALDASAKAQTELGLSDAALDAAQESVDLYRNYIPRSAVNCTYGLASALDTLGLCFGLLGHYKAALEVTEAAVGNYRLLMPKEQGELMPALASALMNYSCRLGDVGLRQSALDAAEESVTLYRRLAAERPDAFIPELAHSLVNLSNCQSELGRPEQALDAGEEAVALYRQLASARPDVFAHHLAIGLSNLASRLNDLGRSVAALDIAEQSLALWRRLADTLPDAFSSQLAMSLNNISNYLSDIGRDDDALNVVTEAVSINRRLVSVRPNAFNADLAMSLINLAKRLYGVNMLKAALEAAEESTALYRALHIERPNVFTRLLAGSLDTLADHLSDIGKSNEAFDAIQEAVVLFRGLDDASPDIYTRDLAILLFNFAKHLRLMGRPEAALKTLEEVVVLRRQLAIAMPDVFTPVLAMSIHGLAVQLRDLGRSQNALTAIEEAVSLYSQLTTDQSNIYKFDLLKALCFFSELLEAEGLLEEAVIQDRAAITALAPLFFADPHSFLQAMALCVTNYDRHARAAQIEPDVNFLAPIIECWTKYAQLGVHNP